MKTTFDERFFFFNSMQQWNNLIKYTNNHSISCPMVHITDWTIILCWTLTQKTDLYITIENNYIGQNLKLYSLGIKRLVLPLTLKDLENPFR